ncbi:MAG: hypothetical protein ACXQTO_02010 [Candidatus Syntropharchaeales archaeon]
MDYTTPGSITLMGWNGCFFEQFGLPEVGYNLEVELGMCGEQTGRKREDGGRKRA